ncbi:RF-1 domain-containing protein [Usnea florida]
MLPFAIYRSTCTVTKSHIRLVTRHFTSQNAAAAAQLPPRLVLKEEDIEEAFLKGSGPGGQKINKTSSAVQLKHVPTGMTIKSQATRSRSQNRKIARQLLADKIEAVEKGPESRTALKAEIKRKKKANKAKKARRKYQTPKDGVEDQDEGGEMDSDKSVDDKVIEERV